MINLPYPPTVNHYYTVVRGRKILSARGRSYKAECGWLMAGQKVARLKYEYFRVRIYVWVPDRRKRDLDNILKPMLDALTEYGAITDDSAVVSLWTDRIGRTAGGRIEINITKGKEPVDEC